MIVMRFLEIVPPEPTKNEVESIFVANSSGEQVPIEQVFTPGTLHQNSRNRAMRSPVKKASKSKLVSKLSFHNYVSGKSGGVNRLDMTKEGLQFENGKIICSICNQVLSVAKFMYRHVQSPKHQQQKAKYLKSRQRNLSISECTPSNTIDNFRIDLLRHIALANITLSGFAMMKPFFQKHLKTELSTGDINDLARTHGKQALQKCFDDINSILSISFSQIGLIFDGTPTFADAEAIKVRVVTRDYEIIELLVRVSLYALKLNGES